MFLESNGYNVVDLGKNVKARDVLAGAKKAGGADVVCLSALMTTTAPKMRESIELFFKRGVRLPNHHWRRSYITGSTPYA